MLARLMLVLALCGSMACGADGSGSDPSGSRGTGADPEPGSTVDAGGQRFPDVEAVAVERASDGVYTFAVTVSSPYDSEERYADAWRVLGPDGEVLGVRELAHPHQTEQPFTRQLAGVEIPDPVVTVEVEARDSVNGWGGATVDAELPTG